MNKIRNNLLYLMTPDEVYNKYGKFKGLGRAYEDFAQFGGQSELDPKKEVQRYSQHRKLDDPEEEKKRLQAEIEDFEMNRDNLGTSAIPTYAGDNESVVPKEGQKEEKKAQTEGDKLEMINKLEEQGAQGVGQLQKSPQKADPAVLKSVRAMKKKASFRLNRSSRFSNLNSRLTNANRFQRSSSYARFQSTKLKPVSGYLKSKSTLSKLLKWTTCSDREEEPRRALARERCATRDW